MTEFSIEIKLLASGILILIAFIAKTVSVRHFSKLSLTDETLSRRWINSSKNAINLLIVIGLFIIWLSELRLAALSLAAFSVALVIALREFIQCFIGSFYQTSARSFSVGDWIKVGPHYGEVVSNNWLTTKLLEIDIEATSYAHTGRTLNVPNHLFISSTTQNLNFMRRFVNHSFSIIRDSDDINICNLVEPIIEKAQQHCAPFYPVAERYNSLIERKLENTLSGPEPSVRITTNNLAKNIFTVTVFCPTNKAIEIEQRITQDFMLLWHQEIERVKNEKSKRRTDNKDKSFVDPNESI